MKIHAQKKKGEFVSLGSVLGPDEYPFVFIWDVFEDY